MRHRSFVSTRDTGSHRVAYTEWGDPGNPRVLVCVHGISRNAADFDTIAEALAADYRVLCPDMPGRGASDWMNDKTLYAEPLYRSVCNALIARAGVDTVHVDLRPLGAGTAFNGSFPCTDEGVVIDGLSAGDYELTLVGHGQYQGQALAPGARVAARIALGGDERHLDRHVAAGPRVVGGVDHPHATAPELRHNAVGTDRRGAH